MSETPTKRRLDLDWVKVVAGALAAVSSAVLLSTLGAVGTIAGAALGSVIVSISSSLYSQGLARGSEKVAVAQTVALRKVGTATEQIQQVRQGTGAEHPSEPTTEVLDDASADPAAAPTHATDDDAALGRAEEQLVEAAAELEQAAEQAAEPATDRLGWRQRVLVLPWKRIGLAAGGLFLVAMVLVTAFEVAGGRSLSSYTERGGGDGGSGTSIGDLVNRGDRGSEEPAEDPTPTDGATRSPAPGGPATDRSTPSDDATSDPTSGTTRTPDPSDPTDDQTSEDPDEDTSEPTPSPTPSTTTSPSPAEPTPTRTRRAG